MTYEKITHLLRCRRVLSVTYKTNQADHDVLALTEIVELASMQTTPNLKSRKITTLWDEETFEDSRGAINRKSNQSIGRSNTQP